MELLRSGAVPCGRSAALEEASRRTAQRQIYGCGMFVTSTSQVDCTPARYKVNRCLRWCTVYVPLTALREVEQYTDTHSALCLCGFRRASAHDRRRASLLLFPYRVPRIHRLRFAHSADCHCNFLQVNEGPHEGSPDMNGSGIGGTIAVSNIFQVKNLSKRGNAVFTLAGSSFDVACGATNLGLNGGGCAHGAR